MSEKSSHAWSREVDQPNRWAVNDFAEKADMHNVPWVPILTRARQLVAVARVLRPALEASRYQPRTPGFAYNTDGQIFTFQLQESGSLTLAGGCPPEGVKVDDIDPIWLTAMVETAINNLEANPDGYNAWSTARQTSGIIPPAPEA